MRYFFLSLLLFASFIAGCGTSEEPVRDAVLSYTKFVTKAYSSGEFGGAETVAGPERMELLKQQTENFNDLRVRLEPRLRSIRILQVDFVSDAAATAVVNESWDLRYVSLLTGKDLWNAYLDLDMHYSLEKTAEQWLVVDVDVRSLAGEEKTFDPFAELPEEIVSTGEGQTAEEFLQTSVLVYLKLLADGYTKQDMSALAHSATERRALKAYYHMSSLGEGNVRMEPRLLAIDILEVNIVTVDAGRVKTRERWNYVYSSTVSGQKVYENLANYTMTYRLVKSYGNRWLVDDILMEDAEKGEGEGTLPFVNRPHGRFEPAGK